METYKQAPVIGSRRVDESAEGSRAKVYFTRVIDAAHLISLYTRINDAIYGKVAIKLHTGEKHGKARAALCEGEPMGWGSHKKRPCIHMGVHVLEPATGFEPATYALRMRRSTS